MIGAQVTVMAEWASYTRLEDGIEVRHLVSGKTDGAAVQWRYRADDEWRDGAPPVERRAVQARGA